MKTLLFSCFGATAMAASLLAQNAPVANSAAQADRKFLKELEQNDGRGAAPVERGDTPAKPVSDLPAEVKREAPAPEAPVAIPKPERAVSSNEAGANRNSRQESDRGREKSPAVYVPRERRAADQKPVARRQTKETNSRTVEVASDESGDPVYERGAGVPAPTRKSIRPNVETTAEAGFATPAREQVVVRRVVPVPEKRISPAAPQPDVVVIKPPKTVTVTRTTNVEPEEEDHHDRHDEHGFFHRLFHHERPHKEMPVTTTTVEESTQPIPPGSR